MHGVGLPSESLAEPARQWFFDHYDKAAGELLEFLAGDGISLAGRRVADIGAGDGVLDLGIVHRAGPAELVGFDIRSTDVETLLARAREFGVPDVLPPSLSFVESAPARVPADDASFDVVVSWSAFEHVQSPPALLEEVQRILRDDGVFFLQLWPFYFSPRGSHLWEWCPEPYHHLIESEHETAARVRSTGLHPRFGETMLDEFAALNRITLDDLGEALLASGLGVRKLELYAEATHVPSAALRHPLSSLGISGVKLLATQLHADERRQLGLDVPAAQRSSTPKTS